MAKLSPLDPRYIRVLQSQSSTEDDAAPPIESGTHYNGRTEDLPNAAAIVGACATCAQLTRYGRWFKLVLAVCVISCVLSSGALILSVILWTRSQDPCVTGVPHRDIDYRRSGEDLCACVTSQADGDGAPSDWISVDVDFEEYEDPPGTASTEETRNCSESGTDAAAAGKCRVRRDSDASDGSPRRSRTRERERERRGREGARRERERGARPGARPRKRCKCAKRRVSDEGTVEEPLHSSIHFYGFPPGLYPLATDGAFRWWRPARWAASHSGFHYNHSSGRLVAQRAGIYYVYSQTDQPETSGRSHAIVINDTVFIKCVRSGTSGSAADALPVHGDSSSCYIGGATELRSGDSVWIKGLHSDGMVAIREQSSYWGAILIQPLPANSSHLNPDPLPAT